MKNTTTAYGSLSKTIHWLMAAIIVALILVGLYMTGLEREDPARLKIFALHKSFGALALMLVVLRLLWLKISPAPALPSVFAAKERKVVKALQGLLYLLMFLVPISGYLMSVSGGYPVSFFGLFKLPMLMGKNHGVHEFMEEAHQLLAYAIAAIIVLHMAGAIKHRLKDKGGESDILKRML